MKERAIENEKSVRTAMGLEDLEGASDDDDDSGESSHAYGNVCRANRQNQKLDLPKFRLRNTTTKTAWSL